MAQVDGGEGVTQLGQQLPPYSDAAQLLLDEGVGHSELVLLQEEHLGVPVGHEAVDDLLTVDVETVGVALLAIETLPDLLLLFQLVESIGVEVVYDSHLNTLGVVQVLQRQ